MMLLLFVLAWLKALVAALRNIPREMRKSLQLELINIAGKEWENASADYLKILKLNRRFIRGELYCTPYHFAPLDEETNPLRANLVRFHDFGLLTINSQPFREADTPVQGGSWFGCCPDPIPNAFSQWRQRPYVEFLLPSAHIDPQQYRRFIDGLVGRDEIYTTYFLPEDTGTKLGNIPRDAHPVTTLRQALDLNLLEFAKWEGFTWVNSQPVAEWPAMDYCNFNGKVAAGKPIEVMVAGKSWDEDPDILEIVLAEAEKAGMKPRFAEEST